MSTPRFPIRITNGAYSDGRQCATGIGADSDPVARRAGGSRASSALRAIGAAASPENGKTAPEAPRIPRSKKKGDGVQILMGVVLVGNPYKGLGLVGVSNNVRMSGPGDPVGCAKREASQESRRVPGEAPGRIDLTAGPRGTGDSDCLVTGLGVLLDRGTNCIPAGSASEERAVYSGTGHGAGAEYIRIGCFGPWFPTVTTTGGVDHE